MRITYFMFLLIFSMFSSNNFAQSFHTLWFKSGPTEVSYPEMRSFNPLDPDNSVHVWQGKFYGIALLKHSATLPASVELNQKIEFTQYVPDAAFYVVVKRLINQEEWPSLGIKAIMPMDASRKIDSEVSNYYKDEKELKRLVVFYYDAGEKEAYRAFLKSQGYNIQVDHYLSNSFEIDSRETDVKKLAAIPFIQYIALPAPEVEINNWDERTNHRVPAVEAGSGVYNLTGENVVVGEWDGTGVGTHIDYDFRHVRMQPHFNNSNGAHATHVAGTVLGGGILNPVAKGMAPRALLYSWDFAGNIPVEMDSGALRQKIEITQNSYSYSSDPCSFRGTYDGTSYALDVLVTKYPYLLHVYAAGNSRSSNCMTGGYRTVHSGFQSSKNALVVAAVTNVDGNSSFHSYGPTMDGRLKPDVSAVGVNVYSTAHNHTYLGGYNGTSMACPGTSGTAALIYEQYEKKFGKQPSAHIIKGLMCNGADDIGRPGPDYMYGYGRINARATADILENNQMITGSLVQSAQYSDTLFVPRNSHDLKVLLAWDDVPASSSVGKSLVNDLDLVLFDSTGNQILPWILNPANPTANAVRGIDTLNNTEQIIISKPASPYYIYRVTGTRIPASSEDFSLNWNIRDTGITVTYPNGDERWVPPSSSANSQIIRWDNRGITGNVRIEYSINAGASWSTIVTSTPAANLYYVWQNCPDTTVTSRALIRISAPGVSDQSDSVFHIMKVPASPSGIVCDSQVHLTWAALSGALAYDVWMHDSGVMKWIGTTSIPEFTARNLNNNVAYWFAVSAQGKNGARSERCQARMFTPLGTIKPPRFTNQPSDMRICLGKDTSVTVSLTGTATLTSYWQYSDNQGATWQKTGLDNQLKLNIINPTMGMNNRLYRHYAVNGCQSKEYSKIAGLYIDTAFSFSYPFSEVKLCIGQDSSINVKFNASNTPETRWFFRKLITDTPVQITGNSPRLPINNAQKSAQGYYSASFKNACGDMTSSGQTFLRIRDELAISVPSNDSLCHGNAYTLQSSASGGDTLRYYYLWKSESAIFTGNKVSLYPSVTTQWTATVFDQCSQDTVKANFTLFMRDSLKLNVSSDTLICKGSGAVLLAKTSGGLTSGYTYNWSDGLSSKADHQVFPLSDQTYYFQFTDNCTQYILRDSVRVKVMAPLAVHIETSEDTLCLGRSVQLKAIATGGLPSKYSFQWGDGPTVAVRTVQPTKGTEYSILLKDNCTSVDAKDTLFLPVRDKLMAKISGTDTSCYDVKTSYSAVVNGGKPSGYRYFWNGVEGGASTDEFPKNSYRLRLIVTDGCTVADAPDSMNVFVFDKPEIGAAFTDSLVCYGQTIMLPISPKGGRAYSQKAVWSNGTTNPNGIQVKCTSDSFFSVTLQDGCSHPVSHTFNVFTRDPLTISAGNNQRICEGQTTTAQVLVNGGLTNSYRIYVNNQEMTQGHTITFTGKQGDKKTYALRAEDGCTVPNAHDTLILGVDDVNPTFDVDQIYDKEVSLLSPATVHEAVYHFGDLNSFSGNQERVNHTYDDYNFYTICRTVTSDIGCIDSSCKRIEIYDVFKSSGFSMQLYPNPASDIVKLSFDRIAGDLSYELIDADGKIVLTQSRINYLDEIIEINLSAFAPGMYWLRVKANEDVKVFKVVKY